MRPDRPSDLTKDLEEALSRPRWSAGICAAATLLGLALSLVAWRFVEPITPDSVAYMEGARSLARSGTYTTLDGYPMLIFPPGYPTLIAALIPPTGSPELAGRLVSLILSTAGIPLVFLLVRPFGSHLLAAGSMTLFALLPERVEHSVMIGSDAPFLLLVLLMVLWSYPWLRTDQLRWAGLTGLTAAAACLVRPEGTILVTVVLTTALIGSRFRRRRMAGAAVAVVIFCIGIFPYVSYLHRHTGRWQLSAKARLNLAIADDVAFGKGWKTLLRLDPSGRIVPGAPSADPVRHLRRFAYNEGQTLVRLARFATPVPFMLTGLGLASLLLSRRYRPLPLECICLLGVLAVPLLYVPVLFINPRFLIQPTLLVLVAGVAGGIHLIDLIEPPARRRAAFVIAALLLGTILAYNAPNFEGAGMQGYADVRANAQWVSENRPEARAVVGRAWYLAYRAELVHLQLPHYPVERVVQYARTYGAALLLLPKSDAHPELCALALDPKPVHGLVPLQDWGDAVLFELADAGTANPRAHSDDATDRIWTRCR